MSEVDDCDPTPQAVAFGARLKEARERAGLSQEDVEARLGFPVRSLTRWENGHRDPGFDKVTRLADCYGVSTDWLAGRTTIFRRLLPGMVIVKVQVLPMLESLVTAGKTIKDVPPHLLRKPGIDYAVVVPEDPEVMAHEAAARIETRMRCIWKQLGGGEL